MKRRVVAPLLALALGLGLLIAAWVLLLPATISLVAPSFTIATRIHDAHSALVRTVSYRLSLTGTGEVRVYLIPGATKAQAKALWCDVVVPAAGEPLGACRGRHPEQRPTEGRGQRAAGESRRGLYRLM